jgi:hypothetical protein
MQKILSKLGLNSFIFITCMNPGRGCAITLSRGYYFLNGTRRSLLLEERRREISENSEKCS